MTDAPVTGHPAIDAATAALGDLREVDLAEHPDRLQAVQDVLASVLDASRDTAQPPIPGVPPR